MGTELTSARNTKISTNKTSTTIIEISLSLVLLFSLAAKYLFSLLLLLIYSWIKTFDILIACDNARSVPNTKRNWLAFE